MIRAPMIMGRSALTMRNLSAHDCLTSSGTQMQCVRWKRKPIWLPTAKTKVFRVPQRPVIPKEDKLELQRLHNVYRTYMNSLRSYIIRVEETKEVQLNELMSQAAETDDFEHCSKMNDQWNRNVAREREIRLATEKQKKKLTIQQKLLEKKQRDAEMQARVNEEIRRAKEESLTFITAANIDEAIERALEAPVDHNYAIDINGNVYKGSEPVPRETNKNTAEAAI